MALQLSNQTVPAMAFSPPATEAIAGYELTQSGDVKRYINGAATDIGDWINPKSGMSGYEVKATLNSGTLFSGVVGSWLNFATNSYSWSARDTVKNGVAVTANLTVQIRQKTNHANTVSATINLSATLSG